MKIKLLAEYIIVISIFTSINIFVEDLQFKTHILNAMFIYVAAKLYHLEKKKADKE